jgi:hypothetical protein
MTCHDQSSGSRRCAGQLRQRCHAADEIFLVSTVIADKWWVMSPAQVGPITMMASGSMKIDPSTLTGLTRR